MTRGDYEGVRQLEPGGTLSRGVGPSRRERGASLVEFALVLPFLLLLVLGIVEFAWLFGLNNDIRHGAREGARYAAVDAGGNPEIRAYMCSAMEPLGGAGFEELRIQLEQLDTNGSPGMQIGDTGSLTVEADVNSLSRLGFIEALMPDQLSSTIEFRIEQGPTWTNDPGLVTVSC